MSRRIPAKSAPFLRRTCHIIHCDLSHEAFSVHQEQAIMASEDRINDVLRFVRNFLLVVSIVLFVYYFGYRAGAAARLEHQPPPLAPLPPMVLHRPLQLFPPLPLLHPLPPVALLRAFPPLQPHQIRPFNDLYVAHRRRL